MNSPLLYGENKQPIYPVVGMDLGCVTRKDLSDWMYKCQLQLQKGVKVGEHGKLMYSWKCAASELCSFKVVVVYVDGRWQVRTVEDHG